MADETRWLTLTLFVVLLLITNVSLGREGESYTPHCFSSSSSCNIRYRTRLDFKFGQLSLMEPIEKRPEKRLVLPTSPYCSAHHPNAPLKLRLHSKRCRYPKRTATSTAADEYDWLKLEKRNQSAATTVASHQLPANC